MQRTHSFEKNLMLGKIDDWRRSGQQRMRWLDGITSSISSWSWWWTGKPGVLQSMRLQRVRHKWATELNEAHHMPNTYILWNMYWKKLSLRMLLLVIKWKSFPHCQNENICFLSFFKLFRFLPLNSVDLMSYCPNILLLPFLRRESVLCWLLPVSMCS